MTSSVLLVRGRLMTSTRSRPNLSPVSARVSSATTSGRELSCFTSQDTWGWLCEMNLLIYPSE